MIGTYPVAIVAIGAAFSGGKWQLLWSEQVKSVMVRGKRSATVGECCRPPGRYGNLAKSLYRISLPQIRQSAQGVAEILKNCGRYGEHGKFGRHPDLALSQQSHLAMSKQSC